MLRKKDEGRPCWGKGRRKESAGGKEGERRKEEGGALAEKGGKAGLSYMKNEKSLSDRVVFGKKNVLLHP